MQIKICCVLSKLSVKHWLLCFFLRYFYVRFTIEFRKGFSAYTWIIWFVIYCPTGSGVSLVPSSNSLPPHWFPQYYCNSIAFNNQAFFLDCFWFSCQRLVVYICVGFILVFVFCSIDVFLCFWISTRLF